MAATIKDIARKLNISTSTVSYALNGGPRSVPDEVKERVLRLAEELDYRPNRVARSLVTRRAMTIGVVPPAIDANVFLSPFVRLAWNGLVNTAESLGQDLMLFTGHDRIAPSDTGRDLLDGRIDGVVFIAPHIGATSIEFLTRRDFPVAMIASGDLPVGLRVSADNEAGVRQAMTHLYSLGHRRIAHVTGGPTAADSRVREAAYRVEMERLGLVVEPGYVQSGAFTIESGAEAADRLMALDPRPTAVFSANDEMAYGLCRRIQELGLCVPEDVSVIGFDDSEMSAVFAPPLTTVRQPIGEMAGAALRAVVRLVDGLSPEPSQHFPTELVVRKTTAPPPVEAISYQNVSGN